MALNQSEVGPGDELTWTINWTTWLAGRNIVNSVWTVPLPAVKLGESNTAKKALVKLRVAGEVGKTYEVTNTITTDGDAQVESRRLQFFVTSR